MMRRHSVAAALAGLAMMASPARALEEPFNPARPQEPEPEPAPQYRPEPWAFSLPHQGSREKARRLRQMQRAE